MRLGQILFRPSERRVSSSRACSSVLCLFAISATEACVGLPSPETRPPHVTAAQAYELGRKYFFGNGVPRDLVRAAKLHQEGCDGGNANACNFLGHMYLKGQGVPQNAGRAAALFGKACDSGVEAACRNVEAAAPKSSSQPQVESRQEEPIRYLPESGAPAETGETASQTGNAVGRGPARDRRKGGTRVWLLRIDAPSESWPSADLDESGRWILRDLEPGRYCALVLDSPPRGPAFAFSKEAEEKLCKRISAGQTTNF